MMHDTLVIGAGVAGLAAAGRLRQAGQDVLVLEKSRGLGGRAATRRWDGLPVDHGAQFFTARSEAFRAQVAQWQDDGVCHLWARGFHQHRNGQLEPASDDGHPRFACRHGMSALGRALADADSLVIEREAKVVAIRAESESWILSDDRARTFRGRRLIMTAPPPQGAALLQDVAPRAAAVLQSFTLHPCLAVVAKYPRLALAWHGIQSDSAEIAWMGHDTSKRPDAHAGQTVIVLHASADFSRRHYEAAEHEIMRALLAHASGIASEDLGAPDGTFLQRWRYATLDAGTYADPAVAVDAPAPLVLAGESFGGGKIEGAWLSGVRAAALVSPPRGEHVNGD